MWPQSAHRIRQQNCEFTLNQQLTLEQSPNQCWSLWAAHPGLLTQLCQNHTHSTYFSSWKQSTGTGCGCWMCAGSTASPSPCPGQPAFQHSHRAHGSAHLTGLPHIQSVPLCHHPHLATCLCGFMGHHDGHNSGSSSSLLSLRALCAGQRFDLFQTEFVPSSERRHKPLFRARRVNAFCSFMEREGQTKRGTEKESTSSFVAFTKSLWCWAAFPNSHLLLLGKSSGSGESTRPLPKPCTNPTLQRAQLGAPRTSPPRLKPWSC